ncbi:MAG: acyl-CoA/acyl-ACP dehydrogenase, partial [Caulobacteraceae bacterium]|nr:acyl-CoA/acyl-ACP dehydrogenase [Caulobacteraceae bacterium]
MVDLIATDEQSQIASSIAAFLAEEMPLSRLTSRRGPEDTDHRFFKPMAELGWFGLGLLEDAGGVGYGAVEEALLFRELGRVLAPPATLATTLAAHASTGDAALRARLLAGEASAAVAVPVGLAQGPTFKGRFQVFEADAVSHVLLLASDAAAVVPLESLGALTPGASADDALRLDLAEVDGVAATVTGDAAGAIWRRAKLLSAAMLAGVCEATRNIASEYAKVRHQFGQPIGVFQAVKHKCSDMAIRADAVNA